MHHDFDTLDFQDIGEGWSECVVEVPKGDTAWHPASTKKVIYGPCKMTYRKAPSGAIEGLEEDLDES